MRIQSNISCFSTEKLNPSKLVKVVFCLPLVFWISAKRMKHKNVLTVTQGWKFSTCLRNNGYPTWFIDKFSQPRNERVPTAEKKKIYFRLPYYGEVSERIATCLRKEIGAAYYHLNPVPVFRTRSLAPTAVKDVIPVFQIPKVVYTFSCPCGARYTGRTERCLAVRCTEHLPKWLNKGGTRPRSKQPPTSAITRHLSTCQFRTAIMEENSKVFEVSRTARTTLELAIMESVTIRQTLPDLCVQKDRLFLLRLC